MAKAYIYTLPEEFMKDPGVPIRWKIYATLTGFWIKGLTFYATNEWLEKELGVTKRAIQYGLAELEELKLIERNLKGYERVILPGGCNPLHGGVQSSNRKGCKRLHHNSDKNADNRISETKVSQGKYEIVKDEVSKPKRVKPVAEQVFAIFKQEVGRAPLNWRSNKSQRTAAENLWNERGEEQIRRALQFYRENKEVKYCPEIITPWDLDTKWAKLAEFRKKQYG